MAAIEPTATNRWRRFNRVLLGCALALAVVLYGFIVLVDPHDHLALSLPAERVPINQNQRFSYPALARSERFDSAVIGTSTSRLLRPSELDRSLGARFVNLSMNSATAYEQARILEVFLRHHPAPRYLMFGIDVVWCTTGPPPPRYTFREFPEWLFDANPWNDYLHVFNGKALEQAIRHVQFWAGWREPRYGSDGYRNFMPSPGEYDLTRAREQLYGALGVRERHVPDSPDQVSESERSAWTMPGIELLDRSLAGIPSGTQVLLFFVPYHLFSQPHPDTREGIRWQECKRRAARLAQGRPGTRAVDFMIPSSITREDAHYWDPLHFTTDIASRLEAALAAAIRNEHHRDDSFDWLYPAAATGSRGSASGEVTRPRSPGDARAVSRRRGPA